MNRHCWLTLAMGARSSVSTCPAPACFFHSFFLMPNPLQLPGPFHPHTSASNSPLAVIYGLFLCASLSLSLWSSHCCPATNSCLLTSKFCNRVSILFKVYLQPPNQHIIICQGVFITRKQKKRSSSFF